MTDEEAIKGLKNVCTRFTGYKPNEEMLAMAIKALEQQPCEDAISRKDMLAIFRQSNSLSQAWNGFEKLPSVTPKEKTAAWVPTDEEPYEAYGGRFTKCNACGWLLYDVDTTDFKYCPNCGARMVIK